METALVYFLILAVLAVIGVALFFRFRFAVTDLESKITGIWVNETNTLRILIYNLESQFRAKVVWTKKDNDPMLGSLVICNMRLNYLRSGQGTYVDPFTREQFNVKVKLKNRSHLLFHLIEQSARRRKKVETWKLVP